MVWFATALGTFVSLKSEITWKARMWTQGILIAPHVCCLLPIPSVLMLVGISLWSYAEIHAVWSGTVFEEPRFIFWTGAYYVGGMALYAGAAYFLTRRALRRFGAEAEVPRPPPDGEGVLVQSKPAPEEHVATDEKGLP